MNSTKCKNCSLVNLSSESACRRCGQEFFGSAPPKARDPRGDTRRTLPVWPLALIVVGGFVAYSYFGNKTQTNQTKANAVNTAAVQPNPQPTLSLRSEYEKQQTGHYKTAIQNSQSLAESQKRLEETQKLMQPQPNQTQK